MATKKNTVVFLIIATIINIALMLGFLLLGFFLLGRFANPENEDGFAMSILAVFVLSIALSWICYSLMLKAYMKKVDIDEKFAPLFKQRKKKNPKKLTSAEADRRQSAR